MQTIDVLQLLLIPICFVIAWTMITLLVVNLWSATKDTVQIAQKMHQIPLS